MGKKRKKTTVVLGSGAKFKMSEEQRYLLRQIKDGYFLYYNYDVSDKLCCQALERLGLVDRKASGVVFLTDNGEQVAMQLDA